MGKKALLFGLVVVLVLVVVFRFFSSPAAVDPVADQAEVGSGQVALPYIPNRFAGFEMVDSYSGPRAINEIIQMHRKEFFLVDGLIARYEQGSSEAIVWISVSRDIAEADDLMRQMVETIPDSTVFRQEEVLKRGDNEIHYVTGIGMDHYYFVEGPYVFWLAVKDQAPEDVLTAFLKAL